MAEVGNGCLVSKLIFHKDVLACDFFTSRSPKTILTQGHSQNFTSETEFGVLWQSSQKLTVFVNFRSEIVGTFFCMKLHHNMQCHN